MNSRRLENGCLQQLSTWRAEKPLADVPITPEPESRVVLPIFKGPRQILDLDELTK
jgi:hypothetical protein